MPARQSVGPQVARHEIDAVEEPGGRDVLPRQLDDGRQVEERGAETRDGLHERERVGGGPAAHVEERRAAPGSTAATRPSACGAAMTFIAPMNERVRAFGTPDSGLDPATRSVRRYQRSQTPRE